MDLRLGGGVVCNHNAIKGQSRSNQGVIKGGSSSWRRRCRSGRRRRAATPGHATHVHGSAGCTFACARRARRHGHGLEHGSIMAPSCHTHVREAAQAFEGVPGVEAAVMSMPSANERTWEKLPRPSRACWALRPPCSCRVSDATDEGATQPWRGVPFFSTKHVRRWPIGRIGHVPSAAGARCGLIAS